MRVRFGELSQAEVDARERLCERARFAITLA